MARLLLSQAKLAVMREQSQEAIDMLQSARSTYQEIGDLRGMAMASLLVAQLYLKRKQLGRAVQAAASTLRAIQLNDLLRPGTLLGAIRQRGDW